jgi:UDP-glucose:(heptosyl)LPS alpha-1,3-glucosyltransferase
VRIALVVHDFDRHGGHNRYVAELATRFAPEHDVHVFANTFGTPVPTGATAHRVLAWRARALTTILSFPVSATLATRVGFDIVHAQGVCVADANVVTAHVCNAAWYQACRTQGRGGTARDALFESLVVPLERRIYRRRNVSVIAVSHRVAMDLCEHYGCRAPITVVPHGIDWEQFNPSVRETWRERVRARLTLDTREVVFLFIGDPRKGLDAALAALATLRAGRMVVVSKSPLEPYGAIARELGIQARVTFAGATPAVHEFLAAADVLLFPTPYDAFGLVLTEAMACGVPVISSRAAGAAEWITDGESGWLLPDAWTNEDLAAHMRLVVDDPAAAAVVGARAVSAVAALNWDVVARATLAVYHSAPRRRWPRAASAASSAPRAS